MDGIFFDLTILLVVASALGILMHALRLPTVLGYLVTGAVAAGVGLIGPQNQEDIRPFADIGVALLLFTVGLDMNVRELKEIGRSVLVLGLAQVSLTGLLSFILGRVLGLDPLSSLYLALALSMSSTIVVIRLLSQKQDLTSLYGKVTIGLLLLQHVLVMFTLVFLAGIKANGEPPAPVDFILNIGKAVLLVGNVVILSQSVIPFLVHRISRSPELLFIISLAWAFGIAALTSSELIGFSIEIGGFLAGLALANSLEHLQISHWIRPVRDFFILLFFVLLGTQVKAGDPGVIGLAILLALFVLLIKPFIILVLMGLQGFRKHTAFFAALTQGQISEFSLFLAAIGVTLGHISGSLAATITLVGVITMTASTALILHAGSLYRFLRRPLSLFERRGLDRRFAHVREELTDHVVLVGSNRTGHNILHALKRLKIPFVVVDFDPQIVDQLTDKKVNVIFGDISDEDVQERAKLSRAQLVISTIADRDDTLRLLEAFRRIARRPHLIVTAQDIADAKEFYERGADYVLLPHFVSGEHVADILTSQTVASRLADLKAEHGKLLTTPKGHPL